MSTAAAAEPNVAASTPAPAAPAAGDPSPAAQPRNELGQFAAAGAGGDSFNAESIIDGIAAAEDRRTGAASAPTAAAGDASPAAEPAATTAAPTAAPAAAATGAFPAELLARAEVLGMTHYEATALETPAALESELARRAAAAGSAPGAAAGTPAAPAAPAAPASQAPAPQAPAPQGAAPSSAPAAGATDADLLATLTDLPEADFDPAVIQRDKILRGELQRLRDEVRTLREGSKGFADVQKFVQEQTRLQQEQLASQVDALVDDYVESLGEEFVPVFGKGKIAALAANSPYVRVRDELIDAAAAMRPRLPGLDPKELLDRVAQALYPKPYELRAQRLRAEALKNQASKRAIGGPSPTGPAATPADLPLHEDPELKELVARFDRENASS